MDRLNPTRFEAVPVGATFVDRQVVPVAGGLQVVHTPGHSPGHAAYLHLPTGVLITGDSIFNVRQIRWPFRAFCTDYRRNERTAQRLVELDYTTAAFTHGNLFGRGHVGSYALTASPDFDAYVAHSASYVVPLPARTLLTVGVNHADFRPRLAAPLDMHGTSSALAVRLEHGLRGAPGLHHSVLAGLDYKRSDSNVLFSSTPVFGVRTAILQAVLGYELTAADAWGRTALHAAWAVSPGGTVGHNTDADFDASRAGARARYHVQTLAVERATVLPRGWEWNAQLRLQRANANLLGSEQLAVTGADGVRAFREGALYADRGWLLRNEVGPAALAVGDAQVQPFAFVDAAEVGSAYPVAGEPSAVRLGSAGIGVRLTAAAAFHVRAELGRPWKASQPMLDEGWRGHIALSWQF